jgi:DNA-binding transcriptional ArsR family regulator
MDRRVSRSAAAAHVDNGACAAILNHMVNFQPSLDRTFGALADPTRRALLSRLAEQEELSVSALAAPFTVSLPAIMKHLDVLAEAGLVARSKTGRTVACRLTAAPMQAALGWLNRYERFWTERLDRLAAFLEEESSWPPKPPQSPASPSGAGSTRRPQKSSARGPTRKR